MENYFVKLALIENLELLPEEIKLKIKELYAISYLNELYKENINTRSMNRIITENERNFSTDYLKIRNSLLESRPIRNKILLSDFKKLSIQKNSNNDFKTLLGMLICFIEKYYSKILILEYREEEIDKCEKKIDFIISVSDSILRDKDIKSKYWRIGLFSVTSSENDEILNSLAEIQKNNNTFVLEKKCYVNV